MENKKVWTWATEQEFKDYEDYEKNLPQNILEEYGKRLEEDTDNLLTYDIFTQTTYNETLSNIVGFMIGPKINNYKLNAFQFTYPFDKVYPCKVYCMFTENTFYATDYENLREIIEMEIKNQKTSKALSGLIRHFYGKEVIEKAMKNSGI